MGDVRSSGYRFTVADPSHEPPRGCAVNKSPISRNTLFDHLIITRYNLPIPWGRRGNLHADEDWLEERQQLFERYCLPSVVLAERSCPSVTWVLMCAVGSPATLRTFLANVAQLHPWIVPLYLEENFLISDVVDRALEQKSDKPCRFLL